MTLKENRTLDCIILMAARIKAVRSSSTIEFAFNDIPFPDFDEMPQTEKPQAAIRRYLSTTTLNSNLLNGIIPVLPIQDVIPRITPETLASLIDGQYKEVFSKLIIVDCRFKYEYDGGHIRDAINLESDEMMLDLFFKNKEIGKETCVVFHCEFSQNRGPSLAKIFREIDRRINMENYPDLTYSNVYILDGGYRKFHSTCNSYCDGGYVRMYTKRFRLSGALAQSNTQFRRSFDLSSKTQMRSRIRTLSPGYHPTFV